MKKTLLLFFIFIVGCAKTPEPVLTNPGFPKEDKETYDHIIKISQLVDLGDLKVREGLPSIQTQINFEANDKPYATKMLLIKNEGAASVEISFSLSGDDGYTFEKRCKETTLRSGQTCGVRIRWTGRNRYNGTFEGALTVTDRGQIPLFTSMNIPGNIPPSTGGSPSDLKITMSEGFNDYAFGNSPVRYVYVENISNKIVENFSLILPSDYALRTNNCPSTIKPKVRCKALVYFKNYRIDGAMPTSLASGMQVSSSSGTRMINLYTAFGFVATYGMYSPYNPVLAACDGIVVGTRAVTECRRDDTNAIVSNDKCSDPSPTVNYSSPQGEKSSQVYGGVKFELCAEGSSHVDSTRYECNRDYFALAQGTGCAFDSRGSHAQQTNQSFESMGYFYLLLNLDQGMGHSSGNTGQSLIYIVQ